MATTTEITEEQYTAAIEKIDRMLPEPTAMHLMEMLELVRDDEQVHSIDPATMTRNSDWKCFPDCVGCLTERIADAVTRAVLR